MPDDVRPQPRPGAISAGSIPAGAISAGAISAGAPSADRAPGTVLVCGLATLDVVQTVDHVPAADEKLVADSLLVAAGGPAANAAVTCALLGVGVRLVTRIGGGGAGSLVAADLAAHAVDVVDLAGPGGRPPVSTVLVTRTTGGRAVVSVNATAVEPLSDTDAAALLPADVWDGVAVLLVDGHHLDLAMACAVGARARGVPVVLDGGSWKPGLDGLLRLVDVAVVSADFEVPGAFTADAAPGPPTGAAVSGPSAGAAVAASPAGSVAGSPAGSLEASPTGYAVAGSPAGSAVAGSPLPGVGSLEAVAALGPRVVAQSHGAEPIVVLDNAGLLPVPAPAVDVVDTLGAGDVLHGALVAWIARGLGRGADARAAPADLADGLAPADVTDGLAWAAAVASASCASAGARGWADDVARLGRWRAELAHGRGDTGE